MLMVIPGAWAFESGRWTVCGSQSIGRPAGGVDGMGLIEGLKAIGGIAALALAFGFVDASRAETIESALVPALQNNPQLNAQRASGRAADESVPRALSGYRPRVSITASVGEQFTETLTVTRSTNPPTYTHNRGFNVPRSVGATVTQNIFNGYVTANNVRGAE